MIPKMETRFQHLTVRIKIFAINVMNGKAEEPDPQKVMEIVWYPQ